MCVKVSLFNPLLCLESSANNTDNTNIVFLISMFLVNDTSSSSNLPSQCATYTSNAHPTCNIAYTGCSDCECDHSLSAGW
jgi:hypothetical protein